MAVAFPRSWKTFLPTYSIIKFIPAGLSAEPRRKLLQDSLELGAALARLVHPARHHSPPLPELLRSGAHPVVGAVLARRAQVSETHDTAIDPDSEYQSRVFMSLYH